MRLHTTMTPIIMITSKATVTMTNTPTTARMATEAMAMFVHSLGEGGAGGRVGDDSRGPAGSDSRGRVGDEVRGKVKDEG